MKFNLNNNIKVKIKDEGIRMFVKEHNSIVPFDNQLSFKEYNSCQETRVPWPVPAPCSAA